MVSSVDDSARNRRWAEIRARAANLQDTARRNPPGDLVDPIERLAWLAGCGDTPTGEWLAAVEAARADRWRWPDIAEALGDPGGARRVSQRYRDRRG